MAGEVRWHNTTQHTHTHIHTQRKRRTQTRTHPLHTPTHGVDLASRGTAIAAEQAPWRAAAGCWSRRRRRAAAGAGRGGARWHRRSRYQMWTVMNHNCPDHLGLWLLCRSRWHRRSSSSAPPHKWSARCRRRRRAALTPPPASRVGLAAAAATRACLGLGSAAREALQLQSY